MPYQIKSLTYECFSNMEMEWQKCLKDSRANPLFSSWIWQKTWWDIWQPRLKLELFLHGIYKENTLIGIVPCYTYETCKPYGINIKYCEFIGAYSASSDSIRSEYLNFIFPEHLSNEIIPRIFEYFKNENIDKLILLDMDAYDYTANWIISEYAEAHLSYDKGVKIYTNNVFSSYISRLGKHTRLRLYNRRKRLKNHEIKNIVQESDILDFFDRLNKMHINRWGKACFSKHSLLFHKSIAGYFLKTNQLKALCMYVNNELCAVCYDITVNKIRFNLQLGFFPSSDKQISLGTLILGYAIQQAHDDKFITEYDLLAGGGKNSFYKQHFRGEEQQFVTIKIPISLRMKIIENLGYKVFSVIDFNKRFLKNNHKKGIHSILTYYFNDIKNHLIIKKIFIKFKWYSRYLIDEIQAFYINRFRKLPSNKKMYLMVGSESSGTTAIAALLFLDIQKIRFLEEGDNQWVWDAYKKIYKKEHLIRDYPKLCLFDAIKVPGFAAIVPQYLKEFPNTKVIYIVRDPRDYVNSAIKTWKLKNVRELSQISWVRENWLGITNTDPVERLALRWKKYLDIVSELDDIIYVKYEDFCQNKVESIKNLADQTGLTFNRDRVEKLCDKQLCRQSVRAYKPLGPGGWQTGILTEEHIRTIEDICREEMLRWGYELSLPESMHHFAQGN